MQRRWLIDPESIVISMMWFALGGAVGPLPGAAADQSTEVVPQAALPRAGNTDSLNSRQMSSPSPMAPTQMTWGGSQISGNDWAIYTGTSASLSGGIDENGWRMRFIGGYASYSYRGTRRSNGQLRPTNFKGRNGFGDILLGHRMQMGDVILKAFAGISTVHHDVEPFDVENYALGTRYGGSTALELWFNMSDRSWLSSEATYSTVFNSFNGTIRTGYRVWPWLSLGLEAGLVGNNDYEAGRAAGIAAVEFGLLHARDSYMRISLGSSADRDMDLSPYAAVSFAFKY